MRLLCSEEIEGAVVNVGMITESFAEPFPVFRVVFLKEIVFTSHNDDRDWGNDNAANFCMARCLLLHLV